jgi:hypothetical protein
MPSNFAVVFENAKDGNYIREAVLKGETAQAWTQMITVTGAKGLAGNRQVTPESFAVGIAAGFKKACPDTVRCKPARRDQVRRPGRASSRWRVAGG